VALHSLAPCNKDSKAAKRYEVTICILFSAKELVLLKITYKGK